MDWIQYVGLVALVVSIVSFVLTYRLSRRTAITAIRPVLVFEQETDLVWTIRNVGNGPALNVVVTRKGNNAEWELPVRIPALAKEGVVKLPLSWVGRNYHEPLGAYYSDIAQRQYSSSCVDYLSRTHSGNQLRTWLDAEIAPYWQYL
jgi:hypothetical protein